MCRNHLTKDCNTNLVKCTNCNFINDKFKLNKNDKHTAYDDTSCDLLKNRINKKVGTTNYPVPPILTSLKNILEKSKL